MEVAAGTADGMARQCTEWVEQGVRGFKAKVGAIPEDDVERLAAIRAAVGPEIMLRADANQGYTPKEAIRVCESHLAGNSSDHADHAGRDRLRWARLRTAVRWRSHPRPFRSTQE